MEINNFEEISNYLQFDNPQEFYYVQIIQRNKDHDAINTSHNRKIHSYYIYSKDQLLLKKPEIMSLCNKLNARAYINLNRCNASEITCYMISKMAELLAQKDCRMGCRVWDSMCETHSAFGVRDKWLIDVDTKDPNAINTIRKIIGGSIPEGEKVRLTLPTVLGYHLIVDKFNPIQFNLDIPIETAELKQSCNALLYFNKKDPEFLLIYYDRT